MKLHRHNSNSTSAPEATFTGDVQISDYVRRPAPSRVTCARVTFSPGSRTSWKINPLGQSVIVTSGVGRAQTEGQQVVEVLPGDLLWFAPGERHWEGAAPDGEMTCLAVQEEHSNAVVQFLGQVTEEEYRADGAELA